MRAVFPLAILAVAGAAFGVQHLPRALEAEAMADDRPGASHAQHRGEIESVSFDGGSDLPLATLRAAIASRPGQPVADDVLARDRAALQAALVARGYLDATADAAAVSYDADGGAFVAFAVHPGPLYHVRDVRVAPAAGARTVHPPIITVVHGDEALASSIENARQHVAADATVAMREDRATAAVDIVFQTR